MRIDGLVNYSSYMQHFNPLDTRPVADQSANEAASSLKPVKSPEQTAPVQEKESEGTVLRKAAGNIAGKVESNAGRAPLEDIEVETPIETCMSPVIAGKKLAIVPILRAGLGMVSGITALTPTARQMQAPPPFFPAFRSPR